MEYSSLFCHLKKLGTSKTVLHVGCHPDDEEIGLLSYISYKHYGRAVYWSATRGESGQNRINDYRGDALGVYRTWESLAARETDGGECLFGPFIDFGFSKNADEVFARWGREEIVRELVRVIRFVRPQVIISRWAGTLKDGHGQHQAVGQALFDAVELAGAPDSYPEFTFRGLAPWRVGKLYLSTNETVIYPSGELNPRMENDDFLRINTGEYSPLIGCTYQERAWIAYGRHQTQGMTVLPVPGDFYYYLKLVKSAGTIQGRETDLFQGLETGLAGVFNGIGPVSADIHLTLKEVKGFIDEAVGKYTPENYLPLSSPLCSGLELLKILRRRVMEDGIAGSEEQVVMLVLDSKIREFEKVIAHCLGLRLESLCTRPKVTPGESVWVQSRLWNFSGIPIDNMRFVVRTPGSWRVEQGESDVIAGDLSGSMAMNEVFIGDDSALSCPYWLVNPRKGYSYDRPDEALYPEPLSTASLAVECAVTMGSDEITLSAPAMHKKAFPGGYRELPLSVVPPISLHPEFDKRIFLVSGSSREFTLQVTARCNDEERPADGHLELTGPEGWQVYPAFADITLPHVDEAATRAFDVTIPSGTPEGRYLLKYNINCRNRNYGVILTPVRMGAPGLLHPDNPATCIREELLLAPARVEIHIVDARLGGGQRYAYVEGAGDETFPVLRSVGVNIRSLGDAEIAHGDLGAYDAIVVGPNAYLLRGHLADNAHRFLEYVRGGGTLIVQYHGYDYEKHGFAPYRFSYSRPHDRVTDENAPVTVLVPGSRLFHSPNEIGMNDFNGWVHDRGLYFFGKWDDRYVPLLSCADTGEHQKMGGLMYCEYGKGVYMYTGYSFYRQVSAGVPGAFRLFFNMLSMKPEGADIC